LYQASTNTTVKTTLQQFFTGLTSDDIQNLSLVGGVTVTDALNKILDRTIWVGNWIQKTYYRNNQVNFEGSLYIANTETSDVPEENGVVSPNWDKQVSSFDIGDLPERVEQNEQDIENLYNTKLNDVNAGKGIIINKDNPLEPTISAIPQTTAGVFSYNYLTGELETTPLGDFYKALKFDKGDVESVIQEITSDGLIDWFSIDFLGKIQEEYNEFKAGDYTGVISCSTSNTTHKVEFTLEVYKANIEGDVIDSGLTDAPIGSYGVKVLGILTTGAIDLPNNDEAQMSFSGFVSEDFSLEQNQRTRIRVGARKVDSAGQPVTLKHYFGSNHIGFFNVPIPMNTDTVLNKSNVIGATTTDALNSLKQNSNFVYNQGVPADVWTIIHSLDKFPSVTVIDSAGTQVEGNIDYIDNTKLTITFNAGFSGKATLN